MKIVCNTKPSGAISTGEAIATVGRISKMSLQRQMKVFKHNAALRRNAILAESVVSVKVKQG